MKDYLEKHKKIFISLGLATLYSYLCYTWYSLGMGLMMLSTLAFILILVSAFYVKEL